ncbi:MAG TPA: NUDIX hydrolase [Candidatus Magasanikbacteria bacterium]|nr:NUDIX hydrolase [Candidatus Magasanikbacteria bacterium]
MGISVSKKETMFKSKFLEVVRATFIGLDGKEGIWDYAHRENDIASIIAFTPDKKIVLIRQFRIPIGEYILQLPVGKIDKEDINPASAAEREFLEETGYVVDEVIPLSAYYSSPSLIDNKIHLFCGFNAKKFAETNHENAEDIEVVLCSKEEVLEKIGKENVNMGILSALMLAEKYLESR